jgi:hypothetical protein
VHRIATIEGGDLSVLDSLWPVDSIELLVPSFGALRAAYMQTRQALAEADERYHRLPILVRVFACIDETAGQAAVRFDVNVRRHSPEHLNNIWYVGTAAGLRGLLEDVATLQLCDGVVIHHLGSTSEGTAVRRD